MFVKKQMTVFSQTVMCGLNWCKCTTQYKKSKAENFRNIETESSDRPKHLPQKWLRRSSKDRPPHGHAEGDGSGESGGRGPSGSLQSGLKTKWQFWKSDVTTVRSKARDTSVPLGIVHLCEGLVVFQSWQPLKSSSKIDRIYRWTRELLCLKNLNQVFQK